MTTRPINSRGIVMKKYYIERINGDNKRPGMPDSGYLVRFRFHPDFGWTGMKCFKSQKEAEYFANNLTPEGDISK